MPRQPAAPDRLTRQKIIDSALALYAEHGIDGVPVRALTSHAGVNIAAIHYHFGGAEALAEEVFNELSERVNRRRAAVLEDLLSASRQRGQAAQVADIVAAFVEPYFGQGDNTEGQLLAHFILKHRLSPSPMTERVVKKQFDPMARRYVAALSEAAPQIPADQMFWRYMFMVSAVVLFVSDRGKLRRVKRLSGSKAVPDDVDTLRAALVSFVVGGILSAPAAPPGVAQAPVRSGAKPLRGRPLPSAPSA